MKKRNDQREAKQRGRLVTTSGGTYCETGLYDRWAKEAVRTCGIQNNAGVHSDVRVDVSCKGRWMSKSEGVGAGGKHKIDRRISFQYLAVSKAFTRLS